MIFNMKTHKNKQTQDHFHYRMQKYLVFCFQQLLNFLIQIFRGKSQRNVMAGCAIFDEYFSFQISSYLIKGLHYYILRSMLQSSYKLTRKNFETEFELDNDLAFYNAHYPFPNDLQIYNKYKSFKTIFEFNGTQLPQHYTKRLSLINRIHYTIKLKQIKRQEITPVTSSKHFIRYLLYYEPVAYSMAFAGENSYYVAMTPAKLQKILYQTVKDLIDLNIYCELTASYCGFTDNGQFRIFVPPFDVLNQRKLFTTDKQAIMNSADIIVRFWQAKTIQNRQEPIIDPIFRASYRFNSPQPKREAIEHRNSEDNSIDVKKTIKISKNYSKEINDQNTKKSSKLHQLKKHKSLQTILIDTNQRDEKKGYQFLSKIQELNKKINNIRSVIRSKKQDAQQSRKKLIQTNHNVNQFNNPYLAKDLGQLQENFQGQTIFDKYQEIIPYPSIKNYKSQYKLQNKNVSNYTQHKQYPKNYWSQIRGSYNQQNYEPNLKLRRTTQPVQQKFKIIQIKSNQSNWYHQSAGNRVLKRIIQKNKQICPQIFQANQNRSVSKNSAGRLIQIQPSLRSGHSKNEKDQNKVRLKKMVSLDNFESNVQTRSINLSQFSNDLSNVKKHRQRQLKNKKIKQKIQQIVMKSKKAIELLKNPSKRTNK